MLISAGKIVLSVMRKGGRNLEIFYRCHRILSEKDRLALVIQLGLDYGTVVLSNESAGIQNRLLRIEKKYLRVLEGPTYRDRTDAAGGLQHIYL